MTPVRKTHPDAVDFKPVDWTGIYPPSLPISAVPDHVAIVMDGNGRWANARGLTRIEGHRAGEASLLDVVAGAIQIGVRYLSVYAFSTENWKRSPEEVRFLMGFNREVLHRRRDQLNDWGVRVRWAGFWTVQCRCSEPRGSRRTRRSRQCIAWGGRRASTMARMRLVRFFCCSICSASSNEYGN